MAECGVAEKRPTLVLVLAKLDAYGQQMDMLPCVPIEEKATKTSVYALALKPLISSTSSASDRDLLGP